MYEEKIFCFFGEVKLHSLSVHMSCIKPTFNSFPCQSHIRRHLRRFLMILSLLSMFNVREFTVSCHTPVRLPLYARKRLIKSSLYQNVSSSEMSHGDWKQFTLLKQTLSVRMACIGPQALHTSLQDAWQDSLYHLHLSHMHV